MAHFVDIGVLVIAAILSAALVLRFRIIGFFIGVVTVWALGILRIELLYRLEPQRDAAMLDASWVAVLGWIVGVIWCLPFFAGRLLYLWRRRVRRETHSA
jgi:hypothetical protein